MKILCSWQRAMVKHELGVALAALKLAKTWVFKGYKSWWCHGDIDMAILEVNDALKHIDDMTPPPSRKLARMELMRPKGEIDGKASA